MNFPTTRLAALKVALRDGLRGLETLDAVQVTSAFVGDQTDARESIQFIGEDTIEGDWAAIGKRSRDERITLQGSIIVRRPGAGEDVIEAARDRAVELMAEVESFIVADPSVARTVFQCRVRPTRANEGADAKGRYCALLFEIEAFSRLQAS